ncbi:MAG: hypothetical protein HY300_17130 [Verrucomicrobia bacterium]|nr:hypothetical protein [Verrucomicrobiota bacterium]
MADLTNILIFLTPYALAIGYLVCWHKFLKNEDPDHEPAQPASVKSPKNESSADHGTLAHA